MLKMKIHSMLIILVKFPDKDQILNSLNSFREVVLWLIINSIDKIQWRIKIKCLTCLTKINKWVMILDLTQVWWIRIIKINSRIKWTNSIGNRLKTFLQEDLWESLELSNYLMNQLQSHFLEMETIYHKDLNKVTNSSKWIRVWIRCKIRDKANSRIIKTLIKDITRTTTIWTWWIKITWIKETIMMVNRWIKWTTWTTWTTRTARITWTTWTTWITWMIINRWTTWMMGNKWTIWCRTTRSITTCLTTKCSHRTCLNKTTK